MQDSRPPEASDVERAARVYGTSGGGVAAAS